GTQLAFCTFVGGTIDEEPTRMALHSDGSIYVIGWTNSKDYPLTPGAVDTTLGGFFEGFVTRLAPAGDALVFSTYLGGTTELPKDVAVDSAGNAYVCGYSESGDYPTTAGAFDTVFGGPVDAV